MCGTCIITVCKENNVKLSECFIGQIVAPINGHMMPGPVAGHIVSLEKNTSGEIIPVIQWVGEDEQRGTHHANIEPYKEKS